MMDNTEKPLIEVKNISLRYYSMKRDVKSLMTDYFHRKPLLHSATILQNVSFNVNRGELVCLSGSNGSGKSTLLYALCGKMALASGEISVNGELTAFLGSAPGVDVHKPGIELLVHLAYLHGRKRKDIEDTLDFISAISGLPIQIIIEQPIYTYSKGMIARLESAFPLCFYTDITLFDETWASGDENFREAAYKIAKANLRKGCCFVLVSHSEEIWNAVSLLGGRFIVLGEGTLIYDGKDKYRARDLYLQSTKFKSSAEATL